MSMPPRTAAFTLLEMMVVLAIAALIIGIGVGGIQRMTAEHDLLRVAHEAERVFMQSMTRTLATAQAQEVDLEAMRQNTKLTLKRFGASVYITAKGQHLLLRPGGLCEPLTLRWQQGESWVSATLDPLTGSFLELEENL